MLHIIHLTLRQVSWIYVHHQAALQQDGERRRVAGTGHTAQGVVRQLLLQVERGNEVLVEPAPVGDQLQYLALPEEGVFTLLLAPAAGTAIRGTDLLSQSSSLDPPPDDVGEGRSDGDVTEEVTLRNTNTSRPLSFRHTLPTASWEGKRERDMSKLSSFFDPPTAVLGQPLNGLQPQPAGQILAAAHRPHSSPNAAAAPAIPQRTHSAQLQHRLSSVASSAGIPHTGAGKQGTLADTTLRVRVRVRCYTL
ncbi:hypothetical protein F7725_024983 [Dissostichus mawsoni]|uniref:Uncharacterized protein n=1 Tax=Dissostichus mawsoni TaxID=36200 RepID=A0A7J5XAU7_DISMA|nr:hypothetical protein F7725_024983 [Dissostichus mawsoni]